MLAVSEGVTDTCDVVGTVVDSSDLEGVVFGLFVVVGGFPEVTGSSGEVILMNFQKG